MDEYEVLFKRFTICKPKLMLVKIIAIIVLIALAFALGCLLFAVTVSSVVIIFGLHDVFTVHTKMISDFVDCFTFCCWLLFMLSIVGAVFVLGIGI